MSKSVNFLHIGDIHLGTRYGQLPAAVAAVKRNAIKDSFTYLIDYAIKNKAQLVLLSGDIFDSDDPTQDDISFVIAQLFRLKDAQITTCMIPGNHDWMDETSFWHHFQWPITKLFTSYDFETVEFPELGIEVTGIALDKAHSSENKLASINYTPTMPFSILLMHAAYQNFGKELERDYPFTLVDVQNAPFNYFAFGHYHGFAQILDQPDKQAYYTGTIEGLDFTKNEIGERYALWGSISNNQLQTKQIEIPSKTMFENNLVASEITPDQLDTILQEGADPEALLRLTLTGIASLELLQAIPNLFDQYTSRYLHLDIRDRTVGIPSFDLGESDTYQGLFYQTLKQRMKQSDDDQQKEVIRQALMMGLAAFHDN